MGNCQAIDNATLIIQHPCGRVDKLYWPVSATEVMKLNPGHYVALLLTTTTTTTNHNSNSVRITRIKLLRPTETLILGRAYRLITTEEVMKGLWAKKYAKMRKKQSEAEAEAESADKEQRMREKMGSDFEKTPPPPPPPAARRRSEMEKKKTNQVLKHDGHRPRPRVTTSVNSAAAKSKAWQPSLQSISEAGS